MLEINDYSSRRGILVPLLSKIYTMFKENAERDKLADIPPPEHLITWQHKIRKKLLDINRRFLVAMDGGMLAGVFFYRYEGADIYIEDVQTAWAFRNNPYVINGFLKKLEYDHGTKEATFFVSDRIKVDSDKELLARKGFKDKYEGGWEKLGTFSQAVAAIKLRYNRGIGV